eukprot:762616-Hanusia_phi.AAC.4
MHNIVITQDRVVIFLPTCFDELATGGTMKSATSPRYLTQVALVDQINDRKGEGEAQAGAQDCVHWKFYGWVETNEPIFVKKKACRDE